MSVRPCQAGRIGYDGGPVNHDTHDVWAVCEHDGCTVGSCSGALASQDPRCADVTKLGSRNDVEDHYQSGTGHVLVAPKGMFTRKNPPTVDQIRGETPPPDGCFRGHINATIARNTHRFPVSPEREQQLDRTLDALIERTPVELRLPNTERWKADMRTMARTFGSDVVTTRITNYADRIGRNGIGPLLDHVMTELTAEEDMVSALRGRIGKLPTPLVKAIAGKPLRAVQPMAGQRTQKRLIVNDTAAERKTHFTIRWLERVEGLDPQMVEDANTLDDRTFLARYGSSRTELQTRAAGIARTVTNHLTEAEFTHNLDQSPTDEGHRNVVKQGAILTTNRFMMQIVSPTPPHGKKFIILEATGAGNDSVTVAPVTVLHAPDETEQQQLARTDVRKQGERNLAKLLFPRPTR